MKKDYSEEILTRSDIKLDCGIVIRQPTLREIKNNELKDQGVDYAYYNSIIVAMTRHNYEFEFDLDDTGIDWKDLKTEDLFSMLKLDSILQLDEISQNKEFIKLKYGLKLIFKNDFTFTLDDPNHMFLMDKTNNIVYADEVAIEIRDALMSINGYKKPEKHNPANKAARDMLKWILKEEREDSAERGQSYDIFSMANALVWKIGNYTLDTILDLSPQQIYMGCLTRDLIEYIDHTFQGIYSGAIDSKKVKLKTTWFDKVFKRK